MKLPSKKILLLTLIGIIAVTVPITLSQLKKQQETRSRATGEAPVTFILSPTTLAKNVNENFDVQVLLNSNNNDISALDITLGFDKNVLEISAFQPSTTFNSLFINKPDNQNGTLRYAAGNTSSNPIMGDNLNLGTITFKTLAQGTVNVSFQNTQITASGQSSGLQTSNNSTGTYTISVLSTATPSPTPEPTPTTTTVPTESPTPTAIPIPTDTPVPTSTETPTPTGTPIPTPTPEPTATIIPSPTTNPNDTYLSFTVTLKGIGNIGENKNPKHPQKQLQVEAIDTNGQVFTGTGPITFDSQTNNFTGNVNMGSTLPTGAYTIKVKADKYLKKLIPGVQNITAKTKNDVPQATLLVGDSDDDNKLSATDYNMFLSCFGNKADLPFCMDKDAVDYDDNGVINGVDFNIFLRALATQEGD